MDSHSPRGHRHEARQWTLTIAGLFLAVIVTGLAIAIAAGYL